MAALATALHRKTNSTTTPSTTTRLAWILSFLLGALVVLTAALVALRVLRRRRRQGDTTGGFRAARQRDPGLTRAAYARRRKLTRSRLVFEDELQRATMIRKSQHSRASDSNNNNKNDDCQQVQVPARSQTWHASNAAAARHEGQDPAASQEAAESCCSLNLINGRVVRGQGQGQGEQVLLLSLASTPRPKTPPLLSHPIFRDCCASIGPASSSAKHMSLPIELTRVKTPVAAAGPVGAGNAV